MTIIDFPGGDAAPTPSVNPPALILSFALGDFAVRRVAGFALRRVADEIAARDCGMKQGQVPATQPSTVEEVLDALRKAASWCEGLPPLTDTDRALKAYDQLDTVRRYIKLVDLTESDSNRLQQMVISCYTALCTDREAAASTDPSHSAQALRYRFREIGTVCQALRATPPGLADYDDESIAYPPDDIDLIGEVLAHSGIEPEA